MVSLPSHSMRQDESPQNESAALDTYHRELNLADASLDAVRRNLDLALKDPELPSEIRADLTDLRNRVSRFDRSLTSLASSGPPKYLRNLRWALSGVEAAKRHILLADRDSDVPSSFRSEIESIHGDLESLLQEAVYFGDTPSWIRWLSRPFR